MRATGGVAVVGTGAWGTALAVLLARAGRQVVLCARTAEEALRLQQVGENRLRLPGVLFPAGLLISHRWEVVIPRASVVLLVVPAQRMRENAVRLRPFLELTTAVVGAAKGLETHSHKRMSQVLAEELPDHPPARIAALSGPNLAVEVAQGKPAATVVAAPGPEVPQRVQEALMTPGFRVYTSADLVGVELGGSLKNIIALGAGIADGLEVGDNAKAALITRGLAEMTRLGVAMGAQPMTFAGLAGLGDLVVTCSSRLSRNRYVGQELGRGRPLDQILAGIPHVAEGVYTTRAALALARRHGVDMPIAEEMERVLFEGKDPAEVVLALMERPPGEEWTGLG